MRLTLTEAEYKSIYDALYNHNEMQLANRLKEIKEASTIKGKALENKEKAMRRVAEDKARKVQNKIEQSFQWLNSFQDRKKPITVSELAQESGSSKATIYKHIKEGTIEIVADYFREQEEYKIMRDIEAHDIFNAIVNDLQSINDRDYNQDMKLVKSKHKMKDIEAKFEKKGISYKVLSEGNLSDIARNAPEEHHTAKGVAVKRKYLVNYSDYEKEQDSVVHVRV